MSSLIFFFLFFFSFKRGWLTCYLCVQGSSVAGVSDYHFDRGVCGVCARDACGEGQRGVWKED